MKKSFLILSVIAGVLASTGVAFASSYDDITVGSYPSWAVSALLAGR